MWRQSFLGEEIVQLITKVRRQTWKSVIVFSENDNKIEISKAYVLNVNVFQNNLDRPHLDGKECLSTKNS